jgi:fatty-acyl-CoA synthase
MTGTFKHKKMELVAEGMDISRSEDPIYFDDRVVGAYVPVTLELARALGAGTVKL